MTPALARIRFLYEANPVQDSRKGGEAVGEYCFARSVRSIKQEHSKQLAHERFRARSQPGAPPFLTKDNTVQALGHEALENLLAQHGRGA